MARGEGGRAFGVAGASTSKGMEEDVAGGLRRGCMVWSGLANKWGLCEACVK